MFELSSQACWAAALLLIAILTIELGGNYVLALARGKEQATDFQKTFARAGHGHAGSFATLGLVCIVLVDLSALTGFWAGLARWSVPAAAVLLPAGFFLSSMGRGRTEPSGLIALVYAGAAVLAVGLVTLAVGLIQSAVA